MHTGNNSESVVCRANCAYGERRDLCVLAAGERMSTQRPRPSRDVIGLSQAVTFRLLKSISGHSAGPRLMYGTDECTHCHVTSPSSPACRVAKIEEEREGAEKYTGRCQSAGSCTPYAMLLRRLVFFASLAPIRNPRADQSYAVTAYCDRAGGRRQSRSTSSAGGRMGSVVEGALARADRGRGHAVAGQQQRRRVQVRRWTPRSLDVWSMVRRDGCWGGGR